MSMTTRVANATSPPPFGIQAWKENDETNGPHSGGVRRLPERFRTPRSNPERNRAQGSRPLRWLASQQRNLVMGQRDRGRLQARLLQTQRARPRDRPGQTVVAA